MARNIDSKREEFRKYLERSGVLDTLTKVLVMLYEEPDKPEDALEYVRVNLGDKSPTMADFEAVKNELDIANEKVERLEKENAELRKQLGIEDMDDNGEDGGQNTGDETIPAEVTAGAGI